MKPPVRDFLGKSAPQGYIAGSLRGDVGFMTRPDLVQGKAPIPVNSNYSDRSGARLRAIKNGEMSILSSVPQNDADEDSFTSTSLSMLKSLPDEQGLLAGGSKAADDLEADGIYANIDAKMASRRRKKKLISGDQVDFPEESNKNIIKSNKSSNINSNKEEKSKETDNQEKMEFAKLKNDLSNISEKEWSNFPESGDFRAKRMKKINSKERYTPLPDTTIINLNSEYLESKMIVEEDSLVSSARKKVLGNKLDNLIGNNASSLIEDSSLSLSSIFDPEAYLRNLLSKSQNDVDKKARTLLKSILSSDKDNSDAWLMAIKLEYNSGNLKYAKRLMEMAIEACSQSEELWIWYTRELEPKNISLVNRALSFIPESIYFWTRAIELQTNPMSKRGVLLKALELHPKNKAFWIELLKLETIDRENRILLLKKAVDCLPDQVSFWIDLIKHTFPNHEEIKKIINTARKSCPRSHEIWIAAASLENDPSIIEKGIKILPDAPWLDSAIQAIDNKEKNQIGNEIETKTENQFFIPGTIVKELKISNLEIISDSFGKSLKIGEMLLENFITTIFCNLGEKMEIDGNLNLILKIIQKYYLDTNFERNEIQRNEMENDHKDNYDHEKKYKDNQRQRAKKFYDMIIETNRVNSEFWLSYIDYLDDSNSILEMAIQSNNNSLNDENLIIEIAKKYKQKGLKKEALVLLQSQKSPYSSRILSKIISITEDLNLAKRAIEEQYPLDGHLWFKLCRLDNSQWSIAIERVKNYSLLWIGASDYYQKSNFPIKARAILEQARKFMPQSQEIWIASIELEYNLKQEIMGRHLLIQALKIHPKSPSIILEALIRDNEYKFANSGNMDMDSMENSYASILMRKAINLRHENIKESKRLFEEALKLDSNNVDIMGAYAKCHEIDIVGRNKRILEERDGAKWNVWKLRNYHLKCDFEKFVNEAILLK